MLLTISTTVSPATDLGLLLHKHPDRLQSFDLSFGRSVVFYPEATIDRCTAALAVEIDAVDRSEQRREHGQDAAYVSDRPYVAGSYLSTALARVFSTAMSGRCAEQPALAATAIPLEIVVTPVACRSRLTAEAVFGPLGWTVEDEALPLDTAFPMWDAPQGKNEVYRRLRLKGAMRLSDALRHLYILLPVLDGAKHYRFSDDEADKLLRFGDGWLERHPARAVIVRRFLKSHRPLVEAVEEALAESEGEGGEETAIIAADDEAAVVTANSEAGLERPLRLQEVRLRTVLDTLARAGARRVADFGCGEGNLVAAILADRRFDGVVGIEPSPVALARAARRLGWERMSGLERNRVSLIQGAATYPDTRLAGCDAAALVEVVEHIAPWRLDLLEDTVFGMMQPRLVLMTTPNRERNATFPTLAEGALRHRDHRFEWTRAEFRTWCEGVAKRRGYGFEWFPIGDDLEGFGPPTQGALFTKVDCDPL